MAPTEVGDLAKPAGRSRDETLATHHGLEEHATDVGITLQELCDGLARAGERQAPDPGMEQRQEGFSKRRARGDLERAESQSVVGRIEGQDPGLARCEAGCLERNLHSVGPGGREVDPRVLDRGSSTELACQPHPRGVSVNVAEAVKEPRGLLTNRGQNQRVSMTHGRDAETGGQVEKAVAIDVEHIGAQRLFPNKSVFTRSEGVDARGFVVAEIATQLS